MEEKMFVNAEDIAKDLEISKPFAYKLMRNMNEELKTRGFITIAGRVSRQFYEEKFYGIKKTSGEKERKNAGIQG